MHGDDAWESAQPSLQDMKIAPPVHVGLGDHEFPLCLILLNPELAIKNRAQNPESDLSLNSDLDLTFCVTLENC